MSKSESDTAFDRKKWIIFLSVSITSLVFDVVTKIWARSTLPVHGHGSGPGGLCIVPDDLITSIATKYKGSILCGGENVSLIDGLWDWRLSMNPGSAFGLFGGLGANVTRVLLSLIGIGAVVGMVYMLRKSRADQRVLHWALALVAGGAIGNLFDRIRDGMVTDFVLWKYHGHEWPVFNVADVVLVVGVGLMFIDIQIESGREKRKRKERKERVQAKAKADGLVKDHRE